MNTMLEYHNKPIGQIRVNKALENDNRGYECAAWWQHEVSRTGIFPLFLRQDPYNKDNWFAGAELPATVSDCYFGSLWCGNPIGKYDKSRDVGRDATIWHRKNIVEAILATGNSINEGGVDYCIIPELWPLVRDYFINRLKDGYKRLPYWYDQFVEGDDEFDSRIGMVGYMGRDLDLCAKSVKDINFHIGFLKERSHVPQYHINTAWAQF